MPSDVAFQQVSGDIYFEGTPSVCYTGVDTTHVFVSGWDGQIWHSRFRSRIDRTWGPWESLGGNADGNVTALTGYGPTYYVFVRTKTNTVQGNRWNGGEWDGWVELPGVTVLSNVSAVASGGGDSNSPGPSPGPARVDLFVRGSDCAIRHLAIQEPVMWPTSLTEQGWEIIGAGFPVPLPMLGTPQALVCPDYEGNQLIHVFTRSVDGEVWLRRMNVATLAWDSWQNLHGKVINDPIPLLLFPGAIDLISRGTRNQFAHTFCAMDWNPWRYHEDQLSGPIASAAALSYLSSEIRTTDIVAAQGLDNRCMWRRLINANQDWTPWQSPTAEPTIITAPPIVIRTRETRILARSEKGTLIEWKYSGN
ncbi:hypothetical protein B0H66DRAFT_601184 [Apodospora peruviana]|uniref:PLL-like beta propeller domain-containing protein n=1 Tax=Apodospora peruviana TaxID=516989 RepID=A0AAE0IBL6_9PEZI|nr:hypothetical protein B0H66DRAFT_601184 [Apodospora peruviana]